MRTAAQLRRLKDTWRFTNARSRSPDRLLYLMETWALSPWSPTEETGAFPLCPAHPYQDLIAGSATRAIQPVWRVPNDTEHLVWTIYLVEILSLAFSKAQWLTYDPIVSSKFFFSFFLHYYRITAINVIFRSLLSRFWYKTCNNAYLIARSCVS